MTVLLCVPSHQTKAVYRNSHFLFFFFNLFFKRMGSVLEINLFISICTKYCFAIGKYSVENVLMILSVKCTYDILKQE